MFFNPEAVKPVSRLLDNVIVPDKVGWYEVALLHDFDKLSWSFIRSLNVMQTVIESDVRTRPMWHTYPAPRPPTVTCRPHTLWKGSSTAMQQREEVKNAGTGWMGRGGGGVGATAADTRQIGRSGFGRGRGDAAGGAETLHRMSGSYVHGRGFKGGRLDGGSDGDAYSFRPGGAWAARGGAGAAQKQPTAWRPVGTWARGGGRGGNGRPRPW